MKPKSSPKPPPIRMVCHHAETCLPDYWHGHHLPHVSIFARRGMTIGQVRDEIMDEVRQGAIMGSDRDSCLLAAELVLPEDEAEADALVAAVYKSVKALRAANGKRELFMELPEEQDEEDCEHTSMAYFVFQRVE